MGRGRKDGGLMEESKGKERGRRGRGGEMWNEKGKGKKEGGV